MDRHTLNLVSLAIGFFGGLFLSYDLLGSKGGILRRLLAAIPFGAANAVVYFIDKDNTFVIINPAITAGLYILVGVGVGMVSYTEDHVPLSELGRSRLIKIYIQAFLVMAAVFSIVIIVGFFTGNGLHQLIFLGVTTAGALGAVTLERIAASLPERRLGSIGAFLTTIAFAIQFGLAL